MSIVRPANDALISILKRIRMRMTINKAIVVSSTSKGDLSVVEVVAIGSLDQLVLLSHLILSEEVVLQTIAFLQSNEELPVIRREHLHDNTYRMVLWDVTENKPRLIDGESIVAEYRDVL